MSDRLAEFLFEKDIGVKWIAGYSEEVDWLDSSAMDLLFFNELLSGDDSETDLQRIQRTASRISQIAQGLTQELGFGIFVRKQRTGGVKNLLANSSDEND
jgi:hypothetical protein